MVYKIMLMGLLAIYSCLEIQAQQELEDVIHLEDGAIIHGKVWEYDPQGNIKIKILGRGTLVYESSKVVKIEKKAKVPSEYNPSDVGFYCIIGVETYFGNNVSGSIGLSLSISMGWSLHRILGLGVGAAIMVEPRGVFLPIYANIRGNFMKSSTSFFYDINVGYDIVLRTFNIVDEALDAVILQREGGLYLRPSIGLRFPSKRRAHVFLDLGCLIQSFRGDYLDENTKEEFSRHRTIYTPSIRVGIAF